MLKESWNEPNFMLSEPSCRGHEPVWGSGSEADSGSGFKTVSRSDSAAEVTTDWSRWETGQLLYIRSNQPTWTIHSSQVRIP